MHGIVSILDEEHYSSVESIWGELEQECGLVGVKMTPLPHFSWQIAEAYDLKKTRIVLEDFSRSAKPFSIHTTGLGLFTGGTPVVYIPIVKDEYLLGLHKMIWERSLEAVLGASPYYSPGQWVPHITLAYGDVTPEKLSCAMGILSSRSLNWEIDIDHIALVYQPDGQQGWLKERFDFKNG